MKNTFNNTKNSSHGKNLRRYLDDEVFNQLDQASFDIDPTSAKP